MCIGQNLGTPQIQDGSRTPSWITKKPTQRIIENRRFWILDTFKQLSLKKISFLEFFSISSPFLIQCSWDTEPNNPFLCGPDLDDMSRYVGTVRRGIRYNWVTHNSRSWWEKKHKWNIWGVKFLYLKLFFNTENLYPIWYGYQLSISYTTVGVQTSTYTASHLSGSFAEPNPPRFTVCKWIYIIIIWL